MSQPPEKDYRRGTLSKKLGQLSQSIGEKLSVKSKTEFSAEFKGQVEMLESIHRLVSEMLKEARNYVSSSNSGGHDKDKKVLPPIADLGSQMILYGLELGDDSELGYMLVKAGEAQQRMGSVRLTLQETVKNKFMQHFKRYLTDDVEGTQALLKKLENRRLDYDALDRKFRSKKTTGPNDSREYDMAKTKFEESYVSAESKLTGSISGRDEDHYQALSELVHGQIQYHRQCLAELDHLVALMETRQTWAGSGEKRPSRDQFQRLLEIDSELDTTSDKGSSRGVDLFDKKLQTAFDDVKFVDNGAGSSSSSSSSSNKPEKAVASKDSVEGSERLVVALYDFQSTQAGDLSFRKNDLIIVEGKINDDWLTGQTEGRSGMFPSNFVRDLDLDGSAGAGDDAAAAAAAKGAKEFGAFDQQLGYGGNTRVLPGLGAKDHLAGLHSKQVYDARQPGYNDRHGGDAFLKAHPEFHVPACPTCSCREFNRNPFKYGMVCRNCFHDHMPGQFVPPNPSSES